MSTIKRYEDIEAWKRGRQLTAAIYRATSAEAFRRDGALRDQMRRAAVSIVSNIAEGFDRNGAGELRQFLAQAKGSAAELQAQLYVALDVGYIDRSSFEDLYRQAGEVLNLLGGFIRYLAHPKVRGTKFRHTQPETRNPKPEPPPDAINPPLIRRERGEV